MPAITRSFPATLGSIDEATMSQFLAFRKVMELGSYRQAAKELDEAVKGVAQRANGRTTEVWTQHPTIQASAVRNRILRLQEILGGELFSLNGHNNLVPTELAHQVLPHIRQIILIAERLYQKVDDKQIILGFNRTITGRRHAILVHLMNKFSQEGLTFHIRTGTNAELLTALRDAEIDIAIVLEECLNEAEGIAPIDECGITRRTSRLFSERSVIIMSDMNKFEGNSESVPADFLVGNHNIISFSPVDMSRTAESFTKYLEGFLPKHHIDDWETIFSHVLGNQGIALVPEAFKVYSLGGIITKLISPRTNRPAQAFPAWRYAVVHPESNTRPLIMQIEEAICKLAHAGFVSPEGQSQKTE